MIGELMYFVEPETGMRKTWNDMAGEGEMVRSQEKNNAHLFSEDAEVCGRYVLDGFRWF